jgi:flagellar M-ring protein FliF
MSVVIQFFKELGPVRLAIAGFAALFFVLFFSMFVYKVSNSEMLILYSDLELQDSNKIVQELESRNVPYELSGGGTVVKVPSEQVLKLRVSMAKEGIPGKGSIVGYEIFDKEESLGSTSFLQNVKMLRALEGELVRTIENLEPVEKARVHLVVPRKELFSKERQEPRASVVLKIRGAKTLHKQEIDSISHLVASSVPELDVDNITIIDSKGKSLKLSHKEGESGTYASSQNDERKLALENKLKHTVEDLLEKTLGNGKVIAQVTLEMNFDRIVSNSEVYDPDGAVLRSEQSTEEKEKTPTGSDDSLDVSVANNLPGGGAFDPENSGAFATVSRTDDTKNYEISKTVTSQIRDAGAVQKLSVAVLVDGTYVKGENEEKEVYQPRSEEELKKIENIVKVAVGFSPNRNDQLEVINMPFAKDMAELDEEGVDDWLREELPGILQTIVVAAVTLLIFIVVIRPIAMRAFDIRKTDFEINPTLKDQLGLSPKTGSEDDVMINISKSPTPTTPVTVSKINDSVEQHPQETLMLMRRWLNEENQ